MNTATPTDSEHQAHLRTIADDWIQTAVHRRAEGDAEVDKVWSARQYGIADAFEDSAFQIRYVLDKAAHNPSQPANWQEVLELWLTLAEQALKLADTDDNRIVVAYRRAGYEGYMKAAEALRDLMDLKSPTSAGDTDDEDDRTH